MKRIYRYPFPLPPPSPTPLTPDLANPQSNTHSAGFTKEEREGFTLLLNEGFKDSFRHVYPDRTGAYTYWSYRMNARARNTGWWAGPGSCDRSPVGLQLEVQWNLSNMDTLGPIKCVLIREVSSFQGANSTQAHKHSAHDKCREIFRQNATIF